MNRTTVAEVVTRLYSAAGRRFAEPELILYAEALEGVDDEVSIEASRRVVAGVDLGLRPPTPRLLLEYVGVVLAEQRARTPAIPSATGPASSPAEHAAGLAQARAALTKAVSS